MNVSTITKPMMFVGVTFMIPTFVVACAVTPHHNTPENVISASQEDRIISLINQYQKYQIKEHGYAVIISKNDNKHPKFGSLPYYIRLGYNHPDRFETVAHLYTNVALTQLYRNNIITAEIEPVNK